MLKIIVVVLSMIYMCVDLVFVVGHCHEYVYGFSDGVIYEFDLEPIGVVFNRWLILLMICSIYKFNLDRRAEVFVLFFISMMAIILFVNFSLIDPSRGSIVRNVLLMEVIVACSLCKFIAAK